jgi:ribosomal protein S18 acetylase RimI-like enzyme
MASYRIRLFKSKDADAVVKLASAYAAFDRAVPKDWLLSIYDKYPESIWVAEADNKLMGFVIAYETKTPSGGTWGNIELIVVHPNRRRTGIGTTLVEKILEQFKKANVEIAYLFCPATAIEAKKLYETLGFKVNAYHMRKEL